MKENIVLKNVKVGKFAYLVTPDTAYNSKGIFKANILVDEETIVMLENKFIKEINKLVEENEKKKPQLKGKISINDLIFVDYDKEGNDTGRRFIKVKSQFKPKVFDGLLKPITPKDIYMGSLININLTASSYFTASSKSVGVTFHIGGIQVIELVECAEELGEKKTKQVKKETKGSDLGFGIISDSEDNTDKEIGF